MNKEIAERIQIIKEGKIPEGYKKVRSGIIPIEWKESKLSTLISELEGGVSVNSDEGKVDEKNFGVLKAGCVLDGIFKPRESKRIKATEITRAKVNPKKGRIIVSRANTPELVGSVGLVDKDYYNLFLSDKLWQADYLVDSEARWLTNVLSSTKIRNRITLLATGTSRSMQNISKESFLSLKIVVPTYEEQCGITSKVLLWDKAIDLKEKLLQEKQKQKKGLMERLLSGKFRVSGFENKWNEFTLDEILIECNELTTISNQHPVLTSSRKGIYLQSEYFSKQIASEDNIGYKIIKNGEFTYRSMSDDGKFIFNQLTEYEIGIVSPAYGVFKVKSNCNDIFIKEILNSDVFTRNLAKEVQGGTRLSLKFKGLSKIKLKIPDIHEQNAIAKILNTSQKEIDLLKKEIEALKEQKKGLMQLLLTGIVRV